MNVREENGMLIVSGDHTYAIKDKLKELGLRWNTQRKFWYTYDTSIDTREQIKQLTSTVISSRSNNEEADVKVKVKYYGEDNNNEQEVLNAKINNPYQQQPQQQQRNNNNNNIVRQQQQLQRQQPQYRVDNNNVMRQQQYYRRELPTERLYVDKETDVIVEVIDDNEYYY